MLEDTIVISSPASTCVRRLGLALLLLAVPACGLSEYEARMREAQERKEHFDEVKKYLGKALVPPMQKNEKGEDKPVATVYFRPPQGIDSKPKEQRGEMWRYPAGRNSNDFNYVEIAFGAANDKDFTARVLSSCGVDPQAAGSPQQITPPWQEAPMTFDRWERGNVSVNILRGGPKPIAIVFGFKRPESSRKAITLSLQSLGVDQKASTARQFYERSSPWKLEGSPSS